MAQIYARLGDKGESIARLERAYVDRDSNLTYLKVDPVFDEIRPTRRYQALLEKLGMPR
jgi:hypothetical protein